MCRRKDSMDKFFESLREHVMKINLKKKKNEIINKREAETI